jgi:hypothetical protein
MRHVLVVTVDGPKVWRYEDYSSGRHNLYPFECEYVELYRKTKREIFFDQRWEKLDEMTDRSTEHDNVLRLGHLIGFDMHGTRNHEYNQKERLLHRIPEDVNLTEEQKEEVWKTYKARTHFDDVAGIPKGEYTDGVHFWISERVAADSEYGSSTVLKAQVPVDGNLWIKEGDAEMGRAHTAHNLREMKQFFNRDDFEQKLFQAVYDGDVPIEWIKGVWDKREYQQPTYVSIQNFIELLKQEHPEKINLDSDMEEFGVIAKNIEERDDIRQQINFLNRIIELLKKLEAFVLNVDEQFKNLEESVESYDYSPFASRKAHRYYLKELDSILIKTKNLLFDEDQGTCYTDVRDRVRELYKQEYEVMESNFTKLSWDNKFEDFSKAFHSENENTVETYPELLLERNEIAEFIRSLIEKVEKFAEEEKEKLETGEYEQIPMEKEQVFESRADEELREDISKIPDLSPVASDIQKRVESAQERKQKIQELNDYEEDLLDGILLREYSN